MTLLQVAPLWVVSPHQYLRIESTKYIVPISLKDKKETTMHKWAFPMVKRQQFQSLSRHLCQLLLAVAFSPSPRHVIDAQSPVAPCFESLNLFECVYYVFVVYVLGF